MLVRIIIGAVAVCLVVTLGAAYHLTSTVVGKRHDFEDQVRQWVQERTTITEIDVIDEYRSKESYAVVLGKNKVGTPVVAWLTADKAVFDTMDRAVSRESVEEAVRKGFPDARVLHIVPGLDENSRFWEVTLQDRDGRFHYLHYDLFSGKLLTSYIVSPA
ncbi:uncharacterized protein YpmB [Brevibacillus aydinogluensis]|uniref:DUF5590 domain-containing protein n=1 Tax=Brevibacillus aydinogluensis TaxID=927786 RepID=A0AA48MC04_9BACL|nr:DUF5590 domain-containing protein [Brevibacillus aydinogluensis]MDT3415422.1 uncharacterized protein YpmB [Brevibacillus aydinogluensis]CAJ1002797.1 DUF5590 domain-containing protein [Brevibacillus aydinogluensis]